jgi:predicted outer membrane repeat protein
MKNRIMTLSILLHLLLSITLSQTTRFVTTTGAGVKSGTSWDNAYDGSQIQTAIDEASVSEVWVAKGIYTPTVEVGGSGDRYKTFQMKNGVTIYGGFAGTETAVSQRVNFGDLGANETIFSGDIGVEDDSTDNCYHVFYHPEGTNLASSAILDGVVLEGGNAASDVGGGMCNVNSSPTLRYVTVRNNSAGDAGGMSNEGSSPTLTNVTIRNNSAEYGGGGMYNEGSSPILTNVFIIDNSAGDGGGMYNSDSSPTLTNVIIADNTANRGGGIFNEAESSPLLVNVTMSGNSANTSYGGGVYNYYSSPTFSNCIVWGNTAHSDGNEFYLDGGDVPENTVTLNYSCYSNSTNDVQVIHGTFTATNHCTTSDPRFTSGYRIIGLSPCVSKGNNTYNSEPKDVRSEDRIQHGTIDMGAYEWTQGVDPGGILYADASRPNDDGDGLSWATAKKTFQAALDEVFESAEDIYQIWMKAGTYKPTSDYGLGGGSRFYHFRMINAVEIYGGFAGNEIPGNFTIAERNIQTNKTILSGDIGVENDSTDNCYHVFYHPGGYSLTNTAILDGVTITGGNANGTATHSSGGGMYTASSPVLKNLIFTANAASNNGGAISAYGLSPTLTNVLISNNSAANGGGIYTDGSPILTNVTICNNTASKGGGMYNYHWSSPTLNNCIVWGNSATSDGNEFFLHGYEDESGTLTLHYSCYRLRGGDIATINSYEFVTNNCITTSPKFANIHDYRLRGNSPCINAGNNSDNSATYDLRGQTRIQNTTIDMGAYEWTQGVDPGDTLIIYVDAARPDDNGDGLHWTNAKKTLQAALDVASAIDAEQLWVKTGTYKPTSNYGLGGGPRMYHFEMVENTEIYGGFAGTETSVAQRTNFGAGQEHETILSGDIGTIGDSTDNCYHVIYNSTQSNFNNPVLLDGVTISGGNANGENSQSYGGGIYAGTSMILRNLHICNNAASNYGGGVAGGSLNMNNVALRNNTSANYGGGMFIWNSATLTNSTIKNNISGNDGGGIYLDGSSLSTTNVVIAQNSADHRGGGIYNRYGSAAFRNTTMTENTAETGGGMYNYGEYSDTLYNCIVWGNSAGVSGNNVYLAGNDDEKGKLTLYYSCYGGDAGDIQVDFGLFTPDVNCLTTDPFFVGASANPDHPYSIQGISPCVDAGHDSYCGESFDLRGNGYGRTLDKITGAAGTIDMGAYEYLVGNDMLPVELVYFKAKTNNNSIELDWQTAAEVNNYGFEIEKKRMKDEAGIMNWENIGFVEGSGTTNVPKEYSFNDKNFTTGTFIYRLKQIDRDGNFRFSTSVEVTVRSVPKVFALEQNYPNPFNPNTTLGFTLEASGLATLKVYDIVGREVATLVNEELEAGVYHQKQFDARNLAGGVYFSRLTSGNKFQLKKMILMK